MTTQEVKRQFRRLEKKAAKVEELGNANYAKAPDTYWKAVEEFNNEFIAFMNLDIRCLTGMQVLTLIQWENRWRPLVPFKFLLQVSMLMDKHKSV